MHPRAQRRPDSLTTASAPSPGTPASSDMVARPKVMRRPSQFSQPASVLRSEPARAIETRLDAPPTRDAATAPTQGAPTLRPWQEDGRFAVALLAIVIAVNVLVSIWLLGISAPAVAPDAEPMAASIATPDTLLHELRAAGDAASEQ